MTAPARVLVPVAGVLIAAAAVLVLIAFLGPPARVSPPPVDALAPHARTSVDFARLSCVHVRLAAQSIRADAAATTVRSELASARLLAAEALRRDGRFAALSGGVASLDEAVRTDDPNAVRVALSVVLEQCGDAPSLTGMAPGRETGATSRRSGGVRS